MRAVDLPVLADVHQVDARDLADARLPSLWRVVQVLEELEQRLGAGDFDAFLRRGRAGNAQRGKPADRSAQNAARSAAAPQTPCIKALRHGSPLLYFLVIASRSEEHTSELQSLMRISYSVFCL